MIFFSLYELGYSLEEFNSKSIHLHLSELKHFQ